MPAFPLQSILDLSQLRLDEATRRLGELISSEQEAGKRLELLMDYRVEYQARFLESARSGIAREAWQNYRSFLERLDVAVLAAQELVDASSQRTADGQREWVSKQGRVRAFGTLAQRHQSRLMVAEGRREQKSTDEFAARGHAERGGGEGGREKGEG